MRASGKEKERNGGKQSGEQPQLPPRRLIESADTGTENKTCQRVDGDCMTPPVSVALECIARMVVSRVPPTLSAFNYPSISRR